jgi:hypothetical protein
MPAVRLRRPTSYAKFARMAGIGDEQAVDAAFAIADFYSGRLTASAMLDAVGASVLLAPMTNGDDLLVTRSHEMNWLLAFTSPQALGTFARRRDEGGQLWPYATIRGSRLLDEIMPAIPRPAGLAVDIGTTRPMLLPAAAIRGRLR